MVKTFHSVARGRIPGIYLSWSKANEQINEFSGSLNAGYDDIDSAVEFMVAKGGFTEDNITVHGVRKGKYSVREWIRQNKQNLSQGDLTNSDENSENNVEISNHILGYIAGYIHQRPRDKIRDVIISQFSKADINSAKSLLWQKCSHIDVMDNSVPNRVDSATRGAEYAETDDIIDNIYKLFTIDTPPSFVVSAADIHRLPRCEPGELLEPSIIQRLTLVEAQLRQLHQNMDSTVARCIQTDEKVDNVISKAQMSSYAGVTCASVNTKSNVESLGGLTVKMPPPGHRSAHTSGSTRSSSVCNDVPVSVPSGKPALTTVMPGSSKETADSSLKPNLRSRSDNIVAQPVTAHVSQEQSTDGDGFAIPRYAQRKIDRNTQRKVIRGTAPASGSIRGAQVSPPNRDLFVYKVEKDVDNNELKNLIASNGFQINDFKCVSHEDAKFKSFMLSVPKYEFSRLFDTNLWPEGICVRQFKTKRQV